MGFSRQECWSGLPFPSPGDLPNPGIEPRSPALQADTLPSEPPGMGFSKSNAKRELYSNTSLPQDIRESLNDQPNFTPKATREGKTEKPQS